MKAPFIPVLSEYLLASYSLCSPSSHLFDFSALDTRNFPDFEDKEQRNELEDPENDEELEALQNFPKWGYMAPLPYISSYIISLISVPAQWSPPSLD